MKDISGIFRLAQALAAGAALVCAVVAGTSAARAEVHIVALGDSSINGHGVSRSEALPAQLEAALRARGHQVTVSNQGVDGDTTYGVLARLNSAVPQGTDIVVLAIGGNDLILNHQAPQEVAARVAAIKSALRARGIEVYEITHFQLGLIDRLDLHVEQVHNPANTMWHLNAAGYAIVLRRHLAPIEALVRKVEKRAH